MKGHQLYGVRRCRDKWFGHKTTESVADEIARTSAGHCLPVQFFPQVWPMSSLCRKCQKLKSLMVSAMDLAMKNSMYKESKKKFTIQLKLFTTGFSHLSQNTAFAYSVSI